MHLYRLVWEDEAKGREVEIFVHYRLRHNGVEISAVKPTKVTFFCPQTGAALRELRVWTESGRQLLARTFELARDGLQSLEDEIFAQHQQLAGDSAQPAAV